MQRCGAPDLAINSILQYICPPDPDTWVTEIWRARLAKRLKELGLDLRGDFHGRYKTARGRLAAFLSELDPLFRRLLTGETLHPFDNIAFLDFDARRRRLFRAAEKKYFALLADVCSEGTGGYGDVNAEFIDNAKRQAILYDKVKGSPGAPRKALEDESAVRLSNQARKLLLRFRMGVAHVRAARHHGGYRKEESELRRSLRALPVGYQRDEITALLKGRTRRSAVAHYLASQYGEGVDAIQAMLSRGLRSRKSATVTRRNKS